MPLIEILTIIIAIIAWFGIVLLYFKKQILEWLGNRYGKITPPVATPDADGAEANQSFSFATSEKTE